MKARHFGLEVGTEVHSLGSAPHRRDPKPMSQTLVRRPVYAFDGRRIVRVEGARITHRVVALPDGTRRLRTGIRLEENFESDPKTLAEKLIDQARIRLESARVAAETAEACIRSCERVLAGEVPVERHAGFPEVRRPGRPPGRNHRRAAG